MSIKEPRRRRVPVNWNARNTAHNHETRNQPVATGSAHTEPSRGASLACRAKNGELLAQDGRVRRTGIPGRGGIHGSGELGDGPGGRIEVQLLAAQRDHAVELEGGGAAKPGGEAGSCEWRPPGAGVPRPLQQAGIVPAVDRMRDRYRRV